MKRFVPIVLLLFTMHTPACTADSGSHPVVVELFTSQGCSSCPPADELLRKIARDPALRGKVIPLAYHVDYWNHLGWRDPFSSRTWSARQYEYVRALKLKSAYTPQIVINGTKQMVGSNANAVYRAIEEESRRTPEGSLSLRIDGGDAVVRAKSPRAAELIVIAFENGATTDVRSGENSGRTIANDAIARKLVRIAVTGEKAVEQRVPLALEAGMGVAAFLQDATTKRVLTIAVTPPAA